MAGRAPRHPRAEPGGGPTRAGTTRRRGGRRPRPPRRRRADERRRSEPMNGLRKMTSGLPTFPILVMFGLFFFDEWDTAAFNVLAPNIQHAFNLNDRAFGFLVISNLSVVLLVAIPLGYFGDRMPRVWFVASGALVAGVFSLLTGVAGTLLVLVVVRLG